ncbi:hypothetical protein H6P81_016860 [Aristolochia fimbriata]|uniref:Uncharacterized protein n=1 Tax=Aristolochia fimbriata TaxID=158543 RepID=A0AAV7DXU3_ARIFI|nr:hypothetical protein H6P81_016860 [Aristolochia fimbriata]
MKCGGRDRRGRGEGTESMRSKRRKKERREEKRRKKEKERKKRKKEKKKEREGEDGSGYEFVGEVWNMTKRPEFMAWLAEVMQSDVGCFMVVIVVKYKHGV